MTEAYILGAARTAIGKRNGVFADTRPDELAGNLLRTFVGNLNFDPVHIEDVVMGCVTQIGEQGFNIGRMAALLAGFPVSVPGTSVNRMCASSLQAVNFAAQAVKAGAMDLVVGAGVESMSRVSMGSDGGGLSDLLTQRFDIIPQGLSAELICEKWGLSRADVDAFSAESHRRAVIATENGWFDREIVPIQVKKGGESVIARRDEGPRQDTTLEKLANLRSAFKTGGVLTAGSSSQISDGAAAVLIGSESMAAKLNLVPRARVRGMAVVGIDPTIMLTGVVPATQMVLQKSGLTVSDIDLFEVNEAFAPVVMAWSRDLNIDLAKTNVNGGAVALGHPLGASGARLVVTLLHELERRDQTLGLATLCIGFGMAVATVIERI
ncbi:MAG: thiolase family protein [Myxococcales bacterium]|nr:thiolase family protein [Myxococcales bacterium]